MWRVCFETLYAASLDRAVFGIAVHSWIFVFWGVILVFWVDISCLIFTAGYNSGVLVLREGSVLTWVTDSAGVFLSECECCWRISLPINAVKNKWLCFNLVTLSGGCATVSLLRSCMYKRLTDTVTGGFAPLLPSASCCSLFYLHSLTKSHLHSWSTTVFCYMNCSS